MKSTMHNDSNSSTNNRHDRKTSRGLGSFLGMGMGMNIAAQYVNSAFKTPVRTRRRRRGAVAYDAEDPRAPNLLPTPRFQHDML